MEGMGQGTGTLVLVVGPSGAGKDSLIDAARQRFGGRADLVFARRVITRAAQAGGEDHLAMDPAAFEAAERAGGFLLSWRAHDLAYGIPAEAGGELSRGRCVVANVSRRVIGQAERRADRVLVLHVTASPGTLARRLAARGRESEADILARLERQERVETSRSPIVTIRNDGALETAAEAFCAALEAHALRAQAGSAPG